MRKTKILLATFVFVSSTLAAGNFIVFGDSLSDTGNLARFTYNSGKIYNENLANYFGEDFPTPNGGASTLFGGAFGINPPSLKGPNYAQGGATANEDLGMGRTFFSGGFIKFQTSKQIDDFLSNLNAEKEREKLKVVYWIGGNDMRLASEVIHDSPIEENKIMNKSVRDIGKQLKKLTENGISFIIIPDVPDIAYTPKFFKQFAKNTILEGQKLYTEKSWKNFQKGISEDEFEKLLDSSQGEKHEEVIKSAIQELLKKQQIVPTKELVEKWYEKYKEEGKNTSALGEYFNKGVDNELEKLKEKNPKVSFLRPKVSDMISEVVEHPEYYGFNNTTGSAAKTFSSAVVNILRWGAGTGNDRIASFDPEDGKEGKAGLDKKHLWNKGYHYVFGDEFHPSPEAHRIISDYIISLIETKQGITMLDSVSPQITASKDQNRIADVKKGEKKDEISSTSFVKAYVPYGVFRAKEGGRITWKNLDLENAGIVAYADGKGSSIELDQYRIKNIGRISSTILVENGGGIFLKNGILESTRGSKISYPFGARIHGKDSTFILEKSLLKMYGEQSVGLSVGNQGRGKLISSSIETYGKDGKALHLWNGVVISQNSSFKAKDGTAIWIFANDKERNRSYLSLEKSKIEGKDYAIDISSNVTRTPVDANIKVQNSEILGGIMTEDNSTSNIEMRHSLWKMKQSSSISNFSLLDSNVYFSSDQWETLTVDNYFSANSILSMKGKLGEDDSPTDKLIVNGTVEGSTGIDYKNIGGEGGVTNLGIKIIDLKKTTYKNAFQLTHPVYAGDYEYSLIMGGNAAEKEDFYLTSNLISENGKLYIPTNVGYLGAWTREAGISSVEESPKTSTSKRIYLFRPKVMFQSMLPYANIEHSFLNIWHPRNRKNIDFSIQQNKKYLKEKNKATEIEIDSSISKLSYPLNDKSGFLLSLGEGNSKLKDNTRAYFDKNTEIAKLKTREIALGLYYHQNINKKVFFDHTFQYQRIKNIYEIEGRKEKLHGYGFAYSGYADIPISLTEHIEIVPSYQIDVIKHYFPKYHAHAIRQYIGAEFGWKNRNLSVHVGIKYQDDFHKVKGAHNYKQDGFLYSLKLKYYPIETFGFYGDTIWNSDKKTSYQLGIEYKF